MTPRAALSILPLLVAASASGGPLAEAAGPAPGRAGTVVLAAGGDVDSFNPYVATSTLALDVAEQLFPSLMREVPVAGEPPRMEPALARSWALSPDGLTVLFDLRTDARWSDGRPITSADVVYTFKVQTDPRVAWPDADLKARIGSVDAMGPARVRFLMKATTPWTLLDINEGPILPEHAFGAIPVEGWRQTDFAKGLVSGGPFRLGRRLAGESIELLRAEAAADGKAGGGEAGEGEAVARVLLKIVSDPGARLRQLLAGEIDLLEGVSPESAPLVRDRKDLRLIQLDQRMYTFICWNHRLPLFADPRVRRALAMALDRNEMLEKLAAGMGRPSAGPIVSSLWAAIRDLAPLPFDPAAARRLLKEAGWEDRDGDGIVEREGRPFRFDLEFNRGNALRENLATRAASQLAEVGVTATPRPVEWVAFQRKHREGEFDAFVGSRIASTRVSLDDFATGDPLNQAGYSSAALDAVIREASAAATLESAAPLWAKAQRILADDQPLAFLFEQDRLYAASRRLTGLRPGPLGLLGSMPEWGVTSAAESR